MPHALEADLICFNLVRRDSVGERDFLFSSLFHYFSAHLSLSFTFFPSYIHFSLLQSFLLDIKILPFQTTVFFSVSVCVCVLSHPRLKIPRGGCFFSLV